MCTTMLKLVHTAYLGVDWCKRQAQDIIFWPRMNAEIEDLISNCTICSTYKQNNPRKPFPPHSVPERPWEKVGVDLCEFEGQHYLIMVDYYSNFIEADRLRQTTSKHVIEICKFQIRKTWNTKYTRIRQLPSVLQPPIQPVLDTVPVSSPA